MAAIARSGNPAGAGGAVCQAWIPILFAVDGAIYSALPELSDPDGQVILQVAIGAALVVMNFGLVIWQTGQVRSDALRTAG